MNSNAFIPWKIEKIVSKGDYNYAIVRDHPKANKHGYVLHHRIVIENHLSRLLMRHEIVHHINGEKKDNRIENLEVHGRSAHSRSHGFQKGRKMVKLLCPSCKREFIREFRQTHLSKSSKWTACKPTCRGKFSRKLQLHGLISETQNAISENVISVYRRYLIDDSEITHL